MQTCTTHNTPACGKGSKTVYNSEGAGAEGYNVHSECKAEVLPAVESGHRGDLWAGEGGLRQGGPRRVSCSAVWGRGVHFVIPHRRA